jgi:hypothetical protein
MMMVRVATNLCMPTPFLGDKGSKKYTTKKRQRFTFLRKEVYIFLEGRLC